MLNWRLRSRSETTLYAIAQLRVVGCLVVFKEFYFHFSLVSGFGIVYIFSLVVATLEFDSAVRVSGVF